MKVRYSLPSPVLEMTPCLNLTPSDLGSEDRPETVPPEANCLMRDVDAALVAQVLDVPEPQRVTDVHHHREADDPGAGLEVAEDAGVAHAREAIAARQDGKPIFL